MESFSGVERVASDLERQARTLREEKDRLHEELSSARRMRKELATLDGQQWHGARFAVQVGVALVLITAMAVVLALGVP